MRVQRILEKAMKIRIKGNSVRYRLSKTEVKKISEGIEVREETHFPNGTIFTYLLACKSGIENLQAHFENNILRIDIPTNEATHWYNNDKIGHANRLNLENGSQLALLIEKDFQCLDETHEDQTDNYPNPLAELHKMKA